MHLSRVQRSAVRQQIATQFFHHMCAARIYIGNVNRNIGTPRTNIYSNSKWLEKPKESSFASTTSRHKNEQNLLFSVIADRRFRVIAVRRQSVILYIGKVLKMFVHIYRLRTQMASRYD